MPRRAGPWYRKSRSMWFLTHNGQQIPLGISDPNDLAGAQAAAQNYAAGPDLQTAVAQFLARNQGRVKLGTYRGYVWFLSQLVKHFGGSTPLRSLEPHAVEKSAQVARWSQSTRHSYLGAVGTFLRDSGHPLKLRRPPQTSRGAEAVWTDAEFQQVYGAARGDLKPMLIVLRDTGARPGEIAALTCEGVDWPNACAILKDHKNAGKGKTRVIHFAASVMTVLAEQRRQYETGYLFRSETDGPFRGNTLHVRLKRCIKRAGIGRSITAYGLRHWYATRALEAGISSEVVAAAIGNSPAMIHRHYSHLTSSAKVLKELAEKLASRAG